MRPRSRAGDKFMSQGQELCHEYFQLTAPCEKQPCIDMCSSKYKTGKGVCGPAVHQCFCTFSCTV
uniref:Defensin-like protein 123 n=1 Tax=Arabidopsis thaliana TaxID=3702 RepID=DF123_ARATH|nr:PUTATIVE PSEUDOGENE: RecName: Full=Defensin-like protein 123 [Arabidopsis thaliana]BAF01429.1 hypothetical protein [Arabidopsis thaliana]